MPPKCPRATGRGDAAIVRAIGDLGRHLGLEVVAEGVEDQETWDPLAEMGCDIVQGWHLGRPMPVGEMAPWLRSRATRQEAPRPCAPSDPERQARPVTVR